MRFFFTSVYKKQYKKAYDCFSRSVKREVSLLSFVEGSRNVKYLKVLDIKVRDAEKNLIKMKVRALLHLIYKGDLYEAVYEGDVNVYREKDRWKIMTVDLSAGKQKSLGRKAAPGQLQKLEFKSK